MAEESGGLAQQHQSHDQAQGKVRGLTDETPERPPPGGQDRQIDEVKRRMAPQRRVRHHDSGEERKRQDRKRHEDEQPETNDWTEHGPPPEFLDVASTYRSPLSARIGEKA